MVSSLEDGTVINSQIRADDHLVSVQPLRVFEDWMPVATTEVLTTMRLHFFSPLKVCIKPGFSDDKLSRETLCWLAATFDTHITNRCL